MSGTFSFLRKQILNVMSQVYSQEIWWELSQQPKDSSFDAGTNFKTPNKPFSLLNAYCSPDGKGQFLTSGVGSLLSILYVTLPEAFSVSKVNESR